jgi:hypothetical protein
VIASDGAGGALVAWQDGRSGFAHTFGNHVLASGLLDARWPADGLEISNTSQDEDDPRIVADGAGGALVTFLDVRNFHHNVYAVHVKGEGVLDPAWPVGGRALSVTETEQTETALTADGHGGAFATWQDADAVAAQHVRADGTLDPALPENGRVLGNASDTRIEPAIVPPTSERSSRGLDRAGPGVGRFALRVLESGAVAVPDDPWRGRSPSRRRARTRARGHAFPLQAPRGRRAPCALRRAGPARPRARRGRAGGRRAVGRLGPARSAGCAGARRALRPPRDSRRRARADDRGAVGRP